jgi:hypothetical protein
MSVKFTRLGKPLSRAELKDMEYWKVGTMVMMENEK